MSNFERGTLEPLNRTTLPERLGGYRIVGIVGRGGMGVVYEAVQDHLNRTVALKVMNRSTVASVDQLARFQKEVRAAANLHHTNIVPVFEVGEADGDHFYSMQFIDGTSLDRLINSMRTNGKMDVLNGSDPDLSVRKAGMSSTQVLDETRDYPGSGDRLDKGDELPGPGFRVAESDVIERGVDVDVDPRRVTADRRYWKQVAQIGIQVADSLQYAHDKGTIHRDIKPQNLLIDRSGIAWVTDFGLATSITDTEASQSGQIAGTLRYMAPEQLRGVTTAQSDIYSLGLTLYEMLTLRTAFGDSKQSYSYSERIQDEGVVSMRDFCPGLPRDLEAIVLKSISYSADDRYASAAQLASDLRSYVDGRAVSARTTTGVERTWKWAYRNPALSISLSTIFLLLSVFSVVASMGRARVQSLLVESQASTQLAESRLNLATDAFDDILSTYADQSVTAQTELSLDKADSVDAPVTIADTIRLDLLLRFYERFAQESTADEVLDVKIATAKGRLGDVQMRLGQLEKAEAAYHDVVQWISLRESGDSDALKLIESQTLNELGRIVLKKGDVDAAMQHHVAALEKLQSAVDDVNASDDLMFETARTAYLLSSMIARSGVRFEAAGSRPNRRRSNGSDRQTPPTDRMNDTRELFERIGQLIVISDNDQLPNGDAVAPVLDIRRRIRALAGYSVKVFRQLVERHPQEQKFRLALASASQNLAASTLASDPESAKRIYRDSVLLLQNLVDQSNQKPAYVYELAVCLSQSRRFVDDVEAIENLKKSIDDCEQLSARFPTNYEYEYVKLLSTAELAAVSAKNGQLANAEELLRSVVSDLSKLVERIPDQSSLRLVLAQARQQLASLLATQNEAIKPEERANLDVEIVAILSDAIADLDHRSVASNSGFLQSRIENGLKKMLEDAQSRISSDAK